MASPHVPLGGQVCSGNFPWQTPTSWHRLSVPLCLFRPKAGKTAVSELCSWISSGFAIFHAEEEYDEISFVSACRFCDYCPRHALPSEPGEHPGRKITSIGAIQERIPRHWGKLDPAYATCSMGHAQSPIDIKDEKKSDLPVLKINYNAVPLNTIDNGHTLQINDTPGSPQAVGEKTRTLRQFHFHHSTEERLHGHGYDLVAPGGCRC
jgi:hypothetical protein